MNLKKYYRDLLTSNSELTTLLGGADRIVSAYPQEVKIFPLLVYEDTNSNDVAFSDNLPEGTSALVRIHIFTKTVKGYPKAESIADLVHQIFRADYWACNLNQDTSDVQDNVRHRVMDFRREFYSL
jgi:hypothetical protein